MNITTASPQKLNSILEIIDNYQGILLDQFGVLHDGINAYPKAVPLIPILAKKYNKKLLVISNSSRRANRALNKISKLGFDKNDFFGAITSGEIAHQMLRTRPDKFWQNLGFKCIHITWGSRGAISLQGLDLQLVGEVSKADFILAHGTESVSTNSGEYIDKSIHELKQILQDCAALTSTPIPMIVANPDKVTVSGSELAIMPGTLADFYESLGGPVFYMGKPDPIIYDQAINMLGIEKSKLLAIGDSLEHDIKGAQQLGIDQLFVGAGIHAQQIGYNQQSDHHWDEKLFNDLILSNGIMQPTYAMGLLQ